MAGRRSKTIALSLALGLVVVAAVLVFLANDSPYEHVQPKRAQGMTSEAGSSKGSEPTRSPPPPSNPGAVAYTIEPAQRPAPSEPRTDRRQIHAEFAAELSELIARDEEPKLIAALENAIAAKDYGTSSQYLVYLLNHIGTRRSESVLYQVIETPIPDDKDLREDPLLFIANGLLALENVVGRIDSLDAKLHFIRSLEDKIRSEDATFVRTTAARIYLNHAEDRDNANQRVSELH